MKMLRSYFGIFWRLNDTDDYGRW